MSFIRDRIAGKIYTESEFRIFKNAPLPAILTQDVLEAHDADIALPVPLPEFNPVLERADLDGGENINGIWQVKYKVTPLYDTVKEREDAQKQYDENQKIQIRRSVSYGALTQLNVFAEERGYFSIDSLVLYLNSSNVQFKAEAEYGCSQRDAYWERYNEIYAEVDAGTRAEPQNFGDIKDNMPILSWDNINVI